MLLRCIPAQVLLYTIMFCVNASLPIVLSQAENNAEDGKQLLRDLYTNLSSPSLSASSSNPVDLIFVIDRSASVTDAGWQSMLRFIQNLLEHFTVDRDNTRVAVISYSTTVSVDIDGVRSGELSKCAFVSKLQRQLAKKVPSGYSATHDALLRAKDVAMTSRPNAKKAVVVITDGKSNVGPPPVRASIQLRSLVWDRDWNSTANGPQLQVYAFGIKDAYMPEVRSIASPLANHTFYIPTFQAFAELARSLHEDAQPENWYVLGDQAPCSGLCDVNAYCACGTRSGQYLCVCKDGYQGDGMTCSECPRGTYKDSISPYRCLACPTNSTTLATAATNVRQCVCQPPLYQDSAGRPCYVKQCQPLPNIANGRKFHVAGVVRDELADTGLPCQNLPDTSCHFLCDPGYWLDGDPGMVCQANGSWVGKVPTCHIVDCGSLQQHQQEPNHASVEYVNETTTFGSVVRVQCHAGWRAFGDTERVCSHFGVWSGTQTWCMEMRCPALVLTPGLIIMPAICGQAAQMPGSLCDHVCEVGYELQGPPQVVCTETGSWDISTPAVCVDREPPSIRCPDDLTTPITTANFAVVHWKSHPPLVNDNSVEFSITSIGVGDLDEPLRLTAGFHRIKYIARDDAGNMAECTQGITVVDFTVHLVSCPDTDVSINMTNHQQEAVWPGVSFSDHNNVTVAHTCVPANNSLLPAGIYTVVCVPDTHTFQRTRCQFRAVLRQPTCEMPPAPLHGSISCSPTPSSLLTCLPHCKDGYDFHHLPQGAYVCDLDGNWRLRQAGRFWPDCSRKYQPHKATLQGRAKYFYYGGECQNIRDEIAEMFKSFLEQQAWEICGTDTCRVESVSVTCGKDSRRRRRSPSKKRPSFGSERLIDMRGTHKLLVERKIMRREEVQLPADDWQVQGRKGMNKTVSREQAKIMTGTNSETWKLPRKKITQANSGAINLPLKKLAKTYSVVGNLSPQRISKTNSIVSRLPVQKLAKANSAASNLPVQKITETNSVVFKNYNALWKPDYNALGTPDYHALGKPEYNAPEKAEIEAFDRPSGLFLKRSAEAWRQEDADNLGGSSDSQVPAEYEDLYPSGDNLANATTDDSEDEREKDEASVAEVTFTISKELADEHVDDTTQIDLIHFLIDFRHTLESVIQSHNFSFATDNATTMAAESNGTLSAKKSHLVLQEQKLSLPALASCQFGYVTNLGLAMSTQTCVACPAGSYYYMNSDQCMTCPIGYYQPEEAQAHCLSCPGDTVTEFPGAHNRSMCLASCVAGQFSRTGLAPCHLCPLHTYQPIASAAACLPCPMGRKTLNPGAVDVADCVDLCGPGTYSETGLVPCRWCPTGTYQPSDGGTQCLLCQDGLTTANTKSSNESDCFAWDACLALNISCQNGGSCVAQNNMASCMCASGFTGELCEVNLPDCLPFSCQNNGTCVDGVSSFTCDCSPGFTGARCEVNMDECRSSPCQNGGSCLDLVNGFRCFCTFDFTGQRCQSRVQFCDGSVCVHGFCDRGNGPATCLCHPGFAGAACNTSYDLCTSHPCVHVDRCESTPGQFICHCLPGFSGVLCDAAIDPCETSNCSRASTCIPASATHLGYVCKCPGGWSGIFCDNETTADFDLVFTVNSPNGQYVILPSQFMPSLGEFSVCAWLRPDPLSAFATIVSFTLPLSPLTYQGNDDLSYTRAEEFETVFALKHTDKLIVSLFQQSIPTNLSLPFYTWTHLCFTWGPADRTWQVMINGSLAAHGRIIGSGGASPSLPPNLQVVLGQSNPYYSEGSSMWGVYTGDMTQLNIYNHVLSLADVERLAGGRTCNMTFGDVISWTDVIPYAKGDLEIRVTSHCLDINECRFPLAFPCGHHRECLDLLGTYDCSSCSYGYKGDNCEQTEDECLMEMCDHGECVDGPEVYDFRCVCSPGYTGVYCELLINVCASEPCQNGGTCVPETNTCLCPQQHMGPLCERPASPCLPNPCQNHGVCREKENDRFECICPDYFSGGLCERRRSWCEEHVCYNRGVCRNLSASLLSNTIYRNGGFCECQDGWMGQQCEVRVVLSCALSPCLNGGTCLVSSDNRQGYHCQCPGDPGVQLGPNCEYLSSCDMSPCDNDTLCVSLPNNTSVCVCAGGRTCDTSHNRAVVNNSYTTEIFQHSTDKSVVDLFDEHLTSWSTWFYVGLVILCILLIVSATSCVLWRRRYKRPRGDNMNNMADTGRGHLTNPAFHSEELQLEESMYAELTDGYSLPQEDVDVNAVPPSSNIQPENPQRIIIRNMSASSSSSFSSFRSSPSSSKKATEVDDSVKPLLFDDYLVPVIFNNDKLNEARSMSDKDKGDRPLLSGVANSGFESIDYVVSNTMMASANKPTEVEAKSSSSLENMPGAKTVKYINESNLENELTKDNMQREYENSNTMFVGNVKLPDVVNGKAVAVLSGYVTMETTAKSNTRDSSSVETENLGKDSNNVNCSGGYIPADIISSDRPGDYTSTDQDVAEQYVNFTNISGDTGITFKQECREVDEIASINSRPSYVPFVDVWDTTQDNHVLADVTVNDGSRIQAHAVQVSGSSMDSQIMPLQLPNVAIRRPQPRASPQSPSSTSLGDES